MEAALLPVLLTKSAAVRSNRAVTVAPTTGIAKPQGLVPVLHVGGPPDQPENWLGITVEPVSETVDPEGTPGTVHDPRALIAHGGIAPMPLTVTFTVPVPCPGLLITRFVVPVNVAVTVWLLLIVTTQVVAVPEHPAPDQPGKKTAEAPGVSVNVTVPPPKLAEQVVVVVVVQFMPAGLLVTVPEPLMVTVNV